MIWSRGSDALNHGCTWSSSHCCWARPNFHNSDSPETHEAGLRLKSHPFLWLLPVAPCLKHQQTSCLVFLISILKDPRSYRSILSTNEHSNNLVNVRHVIVDEVIRKKYCLTWRSNHSGCVTDHSTFRPTAKKNHQEKSINSSFLFWSRSFLYFSKIAFLKKKLLWCVNEFFWKVKRRAAGEEGKKLWQEMSDTSITELRENAFFSFFSKERIVIYIQFGRNFFGFSHTSLWGWHVNWSVKFFFRISISTIGWSCSMIILLGRKVVEG